MLRLQYYDSLNAELYWHHAFAGLWRDKKLQEGLILQDLLESDAPIVGLSIIQLLQLGAAEG